MAQSQPSRVFLHVSAKGTKFSGPVISLRRNVVLRDCQKKKEKKTGDSRHHFILSRMSHKLRLSPEIWLRRMDAVVCKQKVFNVTTLLLPHLTGYILVLGVRDALTGHLEITPCLSLSQQHYIFLARHSCFLAGWTRGSYIYSIWFVDPAVVPFKDAFMTIVLRAPFLHYPWKYMQSRMDKTINIRLLLHHGSCRYENLYVDGRALKWATNNLLKGDVNFSAISTTTYGVSFFVVIRHLLLIYHSVHYRLK